MKVRRNVALLVVLLIVVGLLAGGLWAPALAQKPVKIGVLTPLSPPGDAAAGQFIVRGAKMAADDVNARGGVLGGRKIELVVEDDSGTPEKGSAGIRKLATQDQVAAVVGQFHSSVMAAVQVLAEQFQIPVFLTQASAKSLTEKHLNYTFRTHVIDPDRVASVESLDQGARLQARGAHRREHRLRHRPGRGDEEDASASMVPGVELKTIIFDRAVVDFTPQLLEIKNWKPDVLLNGGIGTPVYLIIKQAYDVGLSPAVPMLVSYDAPVRAEYWKNLGREGQLRLVHRLLPPHHEAARPGARPSARSTSSSSRRSRSTAPSTPTRRSALLADAINAAKSDKGEDRGQGAARQQVRGLERHHQLHAAARARTGSSGRRRC